MVLLDVRGVARMPLLHIALVQSELFLCRFGRSHGDLKVLVAAPCAPLGLARAKRIHHHSQWYAGPATAANGLIEHIAGTPEPCIH